MGFSYIILDLDKLDIVRWYKKAITFTSEYKALNFANNKNIKNFKIICIND